MEKIWIECQRCGSIFWVFSSEIGSIYPKSSLDYQICTACEKNKSKTSLMYESLISLKEQFGLYFDILRFFFYFCVGALLLFFFGKNI